MTHNEKDIPVWENIGSLLGLSFQIQDDVLDVTADETELGKNINSDADNNKNNLCYTFRYRRCTSQANAYYEEALCLLDTLKNQTKNINRSLDSFTAYQLCLIIWIYIQQNYLLGILINLFAYN